MIRVHKEITSGASFGPTTACGELSTVKRMGQMCCGSGDDHVLNAKERKLVEDHNPADGDLTLPDGPLGRSR